MKAKFLIQISLILTLLAGIISCNQDVVVEYQDAYPISGQWLVTYTLEDGTDVGNGYSTLFVYNTSFDNDSIFITDDGNFWDYKVQAAYSGTTFSVVGGYDLMHDDSTTVASGNIINNDSIYMKLSWASDPGTIYICAGKRATGFPE